MNLTHTILSWAGAAIYILAALLWIKSPTEKVLSPNTSGWGALVGGLVVVPGPKGERLDLIGTFHKQSLWNARAAKATALAALLSGVAMFIT